MVSWTDATWSHGLNIPGCTFYRDRFYVPYCTFRHGFKDKYPLSALNTGSMCKHFYYVGIGTYCCVFITVLQERIAAVQNANIRGLSLNINNCR